MATAVDLDTSLKLLKLIILNNDAAKGMFSEAWKNSRNILCDIKFVVYKTSYKWEEYCDCWYTNEYFEYVSPNGVDIELFKSVTDNIRRGYCPHADPGSRDTSSWTSISLIHAAAAAGNKTIIKYLLTLDKRLRFRITDCAKLPAMIIAVLKNRADIIKYLNVEVLDLSYSDYHSLSNTIKRVWFNRSWYDDPNRVNVCCMVAATRSVEDREVTIKKTIGYCEAFQNPFVLISYAGVALTESCIEVIRCYLNEKEVQTVLQNVIYRQTIHEATKIVSYVSKYVAHFNAELALECILWNNIESLSIILTKLKPGPLQYMGYSFISFAEFLNHEECARALQDFCAKLDNSKPIPKSKRRLLLNDQNEQQHNAMSLKPEESPFTVILELSEQRRYDTQSTCKLLLKICSTKLYDFNYRNKYGMTPVHICLESKRKARCLRSILETLLGQGADANVQDINGRSALYSTLTPYNSPLGYGSNTHHALSTMKTVLYYNAVPTYTKTAIQHVISRDKMNSFYGMYTIPPQQLLSQRIQLLQRRLLPRRLGISTLLFHLWPFLSNSVSQLKSR